MAEVIIPELGEGIKEAIVTFWHHRVGDHIKEGEDVVELATDKAAFNLPSPAAGVLKEIRFQEGERVEVGAVVAVVE